MESRVYVDLDSLLDTRLGTIAKLDTEVLQETLLDLDYYTRRENIFKGIDKEVFDKAYAERDLETLSLSPATLMCRELGKLVVDIVTESHTQPTRGKVRVTVNVYPYSLSDEDKEMVQNCVTYYTGETVDVDVVSLFPELVTPQMLKDTYSLVIMYDYGDWLEKQSLNFAKQQVPDVTLLAPMVYFQNKPTEEDLKEFASEDEPFQVVEMLAKALISLELIDVRYWCSINSINQSSELPLSDRTQFEQG